MSALPLVRVRLKYPDVETLIERFAPNVTRGGIFLASREPKAVGTQIRFEVSLLNGLVVLSGEGRVSWVKPFDPNTPARPHGMGVSFTRLESASKDLFRRLVERRETAKPTNGTATNGTRPPPMPKPPLPYAPELEGIDENGMRRALDRARALAAQVDDLDSLLVAEPQAPASITEALADLPRFLERRRSSTGANRITPEGRPAVERRTPTPPGLPALPNRSNDPDPSSSSS